ncbi:MAG: terminase large subunit [Coriobacteriia bacterium]|nr:terminase large subunit [Coriobacteriia bacterium]
MKHTDKYAELIRSGDIPACKELKLAIKHIEKLKSMFEFRQSEADRGIAFIENECSNTKGRSDNLKLALPQKVWLEVAWGFFHTVNVEKTDPDTMETFIAPEERRLINEVPLVVGRGSGKTTLGAAVGKRGFIADGEHGADVQLLANTREQAGFLYNASRSMLNNRRSILNLMKEHDQIASTKLGLIHRATNSLMSIKTSDYSVLDGTNAHINIFDELHAYTEDFVKVVNDGSNLKRKNWQTWYLTTNGVTRDAVFDRYFTLWLDILHGRTEIYNIMPFIYRLDDISEVYDELKWVKAMPLLGIAPERESVQKDLKKAKNDPIAQAEILAKTFNIPMNNYQSYFTNDECRGSSDKFNAELFTGTDERNARCVIGVDMSDVNDICSVSFMVVVGDKRYFMNKKFAPRAVIEKLPKVQADKYLEWESAGHIHIHELPYNDPRYVFDEVYQFVTFHKILPVKVGYDKWGSRDFINFMGEHFGDICEPVQQTVKELSPQLKVYKAKLGAGEIIFNDPVATWCHMNVQVKSDANKNIFPNKQKSSGKIDVFSSQLDAFIAYENDKEALRTYF